MKIKTWLILTALVLCVSVAIAVQTRFSYTRCSIQDLMTYEAFTGFDPPQDRDGNRYKDLNAIAQDADAVVVATYTGKLSFTDEAIYEKMQVERVLKGADVPQTITFIQAFHFFQKEQTVNTDAAPMKQGHRYVLFMRNCDFSPYRQLPEEMKNPYEACVRTSPFGRYDVTQKDETRVFPREAKVYKFREIADADVAAQGQKELDLYNQFKAQARAMADAP